MGIAEYIVALLVVAVGCQWLAWRLKVPSLLMLLLAGFVLGQFFSPDDILGRDMLFAGVNLAVGIILFEGALGLRFSQVRDLGRPIVRLCSVTVLISWFLATLTMWLLGYDLRLSLLVGALLVVTGPTVINPILRQLRPTRRVSQLLRWEGIVVDPIGAILAVLVYTAVVAIGARSGFTNALLTLGTALLVATVTSVATAWFLAFCMRRQLIPDHLQGVVFLAAGVAVLALSNYVRSESGLLSVTILGILLGNAKGLHVDHIKEFKEHLQILFVGALFVVLAGRVSPQDLALVAPQAAIFSVVMIVAVRPLSVWLGLLGVEVTKQERTLMMGMAPRGIVAAAVASIFVLEFQRAADHAAEQAAQASSEATGEGAQRLADQALSLSRLATEADSVVPFVFFFIVVTVTVYGLGVGRLAERLGLAAAQPEGVLFAGGAPWVVGAASRLNELSVPTLVVSNDPTEVRACRAAGLRTERAGILSEHVIDDLDLAGLGSFVAATADDNTNSLAAGEFSHVLGRSSVYQVKRRDTGEGDSHNKQRRSGTVEKLSAQIAFDPPTDHDTLLVRSRTDMRITLTKLSQQFTLKDFRSEHPESVILFVRSNNHTKVATPRVVQQTLSSGSVIALVRVNEEKAAAKRTEKTQKRADAAVKQAEKRAETAVKQTEKRTRTAKSADSAS